jgi:hypothetical protein
MTTSKTPSSAGRWLAAVGSLVVLLMMTLAWLGANDDVRKTGGLFGFRSARERKIKEKEKEKEPEKVETKLPKPPGVPNAPPAQGPNMAAVTQPDDPADPVLRRVEEAIRITKRRFLNAEPIGPNNPHTPWQIMHGLLALRHDLELKTNRGMVNAVEWISKDPVYRGEHWFLKTRFGGCGHPFSKPYYFEGHVNQFLALMTMANLPLDHKFEVGGGQSVTMQDMIRHAQMMVNANEEISWTLWFLTHYIEPDATWVNSQGKRWSMEMLVRLQTDDEVTSAPCGGTHGLFALAYARNAYLQKHRKLSGVWIEADQKIERALALAKSMQNRDGSFSSHFFREAGWSQEPEERLKASGHMLEWIMMALPQQQLSQKWVQSGAYSVANDLVRFSNSEVDPGPLFHALHAITLYRERMSPRTLNPLDAKPLDLANKPQTKTTKPPEVAANDPKVPMPQGTDPKPTEGEKPMVTPGPNSVATKPNEPKPETPPIEPKPEKEPPVVSGEKPMPKLPMPAEKGEPKPLPMPESTVAELPPLPPLPGKEPGSKAMPVEKPTVVKPAVPGPDEKPILPSLAADPTSPPPLKIVKRNTEGLEKPKDASIGAPPVPVVTQPKGTVLPPLPLDPVDMEPSASGE